MVFAYLGGLVGYVAGAAADVKEPITIQLIKGLLYEAFVVTSPAALALAFVSLGIVAFTLVIKKQQLQARIGRLSAEAAHQQSTKALSEAKLRVLQAQIKPHFLFNTLAALQYWTEQQDLRASILLRNLTEFLRLSSDMMDRELVPFEQEIAQTAEFLKIMQFRMDNKLSVEFDIAPTTLNYCVPPALLLTLVENAIEHGIEPSLTGGVVRICAVLGDNFLRVEVFNSGLPLNPQFDEAVGLKNSRERINAIFGNTARLQLVSQGEPWQTMAQFIVPLKDYNRTNHIS